MLYSVQAAEELQKGPLKQGNQSEHKLQIEKEKGYNHFTLCQ